jgi:uncharacterized protein YndB with AHSA1/START domain
MADSQQSEALIYTRIFEAPRELVFRCMLEPEHLTHFWGPSGMTTPLDGITVDPRPGGVFETVMVADSGAGSYTMRAVYDEIVEPERISWTDAASGMRSVSAFVDLGDGRTEVTIEQRNAPAGFGEAQARAGFSSSLDRFAAYLRRLHAAGAA